jgi:hypothetical protein
MAAEVRARRFTSGAIGFRDSTIEQSSAAQAGMVSTFCVNARFKKTTSYYH